MTEESHEVQVLEPETETATTLVALSAGEMPVVQQNMQAWIDRMFAQEEQNEAELKQNYETFKKRKWAHQPVYQAWRRSVRVLEYYRKLRAVLEQGYVLMPPMDRFMDVIAVRTDKAKPRSQTKRYKHSISGASADKSPIGKGRYVAPEVEVTHFEEWDEDANGGEGKMVGFWETKDFCPPCPPLVAAKPQVVGALERAMAEKIFDEIGILRGGSDPILIGTICSPKNRDKKVNFFIAWWASVEDLRP